MKLLLSILLIGVCGNQIKANERYDEDTSAAESTNDQSDDRNEVIDQIIHYKSMEKGHKADWFTYAKKMHDAKFDLLKKHHNELADLHIHGLKMVKEKGFTAELLRHKLDHAIALHENQMHEWKDMYRGLHKKAHKIYDAHKHELEEFKESLN